MIQIFDGMMQEIQNVLDQSGCEPRDLSVNKEWKKQTDGELILRSDMAYELGGGEYPAYSGTVFLSGAGQDQVLLYGPDLPEITQDVPYTRLAVIGIADHIQADQAGYDRMKQIEYTRYRMQMAGYMMRISAARHREMVRISRKELKAGINLAQVGASMVAAYHSHPDVEWVRIYFVTTPVVNCQQLEHQVMLADGVMESLNEIFQNLEMNCGSCGLRTVCDEVEGLREMHFSRSNKS